MKKSKRVLVIVITLIIAAASIFFLTAQQVPHAALAAQAPGLRGQKFTVATWWNNYDVNTYKPRNDGEQKELDYRKKLLSENGFDFSSVELTNFDNYLQVVSINLTSRNKQYQIYELAADMAIALQKQGLLYPVSDSKAVNFSNRNESAYERPMYNSLVERMMTFGGKQFGWKYGHPNNSWQTAMVFFNADHLRQAGLSAEYIYNLQKNNTWTWDALYDLCKKLSRDTDGDGKPDIYALHCDDPREFIRALVYSNGGDFVTFNNKGKAQNAANNAAVTDALNFYNKLINENLIMTSPFSEWEAEWNLFKDQKISMVFQPEWRKGNSADFKFVYGIALPPKGPRSRHYRIDALDSVFVIPAYYSPSEVDAILKAAELWNTPVDNDWLASHYWSAKNPRDVTETVVMSRDPQYLVVRNHAIIPGYPFEDFVNEFRNSLGKANPAQLIKTWTTKFNIAINNFNK